MKKKMYLLFLIVPLVFLMNIVTINFSLSMMSAPSDIQFFIGFMSLSLLIGVDIIFTHATYSFIIKNKENENK